MRTIRSCVRSRVEPPAPYVTETNDGCKTCNWAMLENSSSDALLVLGGKNSKLKVVGWARKISWMCIVILVPAPLKGSWHRRGCCQDTLVAVRMGGIFGRRCVQEARTPTLGQIGARA